MYVVSFRNEENLLQKYKYNFIQEMLVIHGLVNLLSAFYGKSHSLFKKEAHRKSHFPVNIVCKNKYFRFNALALLFSLPLPILSDYDGVLPSIPLSSENGRFPAGK